MIPRFAAPWCSMTPAVMRIFTRKPSILLALPVIDFHQRLQVAQSGFKGLGDLPVSSIHGLQIHECLATSAIQLRALVVQFAVIHTDVQRSPEHPGPSNCVTCRRSMQMSGPCDLACHCLGLTQGLRNVNVVLTLHQLQQFVSYAAPSHSIETSDLQELLVTHPSSNSIRLNTGTFDLFATRSRSNRSSKHSRPMSSLDRFTSAPIGAPLGQLPRSDNFSFFEPMC